MKKFVKATAQMKIYAVKIRGHTKGEKKNEAAAGRSSVAGA